MRPEWIKALEEHISQAHEIISHFEQETARVEGLDDYTAIGKQKQVATRAGDAAQRLPRLEATLARSNEHLSSLKATSRPTPAPASDLHALLTDLRAAEMHAASAGHDPASVLARRRA